MHISLWRHLVEAERNASVKPGKPGNCFSNCGSGDHLYQNHLKRLLEIQRSGLDFSCIRISGASVMDSENFRTPKDLLLKCSVGQHHACGLGSVLERRTGTHPAPTDSESVCLTRSLGDPSVTRTLQMRGRESENNTCHFA